MKLPAPYHLAIAEYAYSSWSLRGWLIFEKFARELPQPKIHKVSLAGGKKVYDQLDRLEGWDPIPRTVPALLTPEGAVISDSLAMLEELHERYPTAGIWPSDPRKRAVARSLVAEMHSGFFALRTECPMNLRNAYEYPLPPKNGGDHRVQTELKRIEELWQHARSLVVTTGTSTSPWLFGDYCAADIFYAPIAMRIIGYSLPLAFDESKAYVDAHFRDPALRRWRAMAKASSNNSIIHHDVTSKYAAATWPELPDAVVGKPSATAEACINENCPYSGKPVKSFVELPDGRVFGLCNNFCRDKTVADPMAWPEFVEMAFPNMH